MPREPSRTAKPPTLSFREGTEARTARSEVAERLKEERREVDNPFAVATAAVKRMRPGKRRALAARR